MTNDQSSNMNNNDKKKNKQTIRHEVKLELMRSCRIYRKTREETVKYFKSKGYSLSSSNFTILINELKSLKNAKDWFSKEALFFIEEDHMLSVETIKMMEDRLIQEYGQVAATSFYKNSETDATKLVINKNHNPELLLKIIAQFQSLQETKNKMFSATPLVQELMEVHAQQAEEKENENNNNQQNHSEMKTTVTY